jgi:ATP-dependent DNA helicase RecG
LNSPDKTPDQLPVTTLKGVGPRVAQRLQKLGIETVQDVLFHLPLRYQDRTRLVPLGSLRPGDTVTVQGEIRLTEIKYGRKRMLLSRISDGTGSLTLRFFHFNASQQAALARGARITCYGEVRRGPATLEMIHPEYQILQGDEPRDMEQSLTPVYPATEGVHQLTLRGLSERALAYVDRLQEWLPVDILEQQHFMPLVDALRYVHRPPPDAPVDLLISGEHAAVQRLAFEELLAQHLSLRLLRQQSEQHPAAVIAAGSALVQQLQDNLPFRLTAAQQRVIGEIMQDLARGHPMQRLVQGDVGCGKTLVAACAALAVVDAGYQAVIMAPTELLAEQHFHNFSHWLDPLGLQVAWLSGKLKGKPRQAMLGRIQDGSAAVIVGTHALFQADVAFHRLGLVIIDEQHRFGVHQRLALLEKGQAEAMRPHQLIMTATPIPRTLAMTYFADLDSSSIDELPPGRTPVQTVVIPDSRREEVIHRVEEACAEGRQAYWVCPLVEASEVLQCQAAEDTAVVLTEILPAIKVGLVHGRMKPAEKEAIMQAFKQGDIQLLVATTVVEVGVDVPNASLMIIENAERLGLSQLHQLRGRVGRGSAASACVLMYHAPLSQHARARLAAMRETTDGFEIARRDLELRGPGELLGTRQTGLVALHIADLDRDAGLLPEVEAVASEMLNRHPQQVAPLIRRWLGDVQQYRDV